MMPSLEDYLAARTRDRHNSTVSLGLQQIPPVPPKGEVDYLRSQSRDTFIQNNSMPVQHEMHDEGLMNSRHFIPEHETATKTRKGSRFLPALFKQGPLGSVLNFSDEELRLEEEARHLENVPVLMQSWVTKRTKMMTWRATFAVLRQQPSSILLCLYQDIHKKKLVAIYDMYKCYDIYRRDDSSRVRYEFVLAFRQKEVQLACDSIDLAHRWVTMLSDIIQRRFTNESLQEQQQWNAAAAEAQHFHEENYDLRQQNSRLESINREMQQQLAELQMKIQLNSENDKSELSRLHREVDHLQASRERLNMELMKANEDHLNLQELQHVQDESSIMDAVKQAIVETHLVDSVGLQVQSIKQELGICQQELTQIVKSSVQSSQFDSVLDQVQSKLGPMSTNLEKIMTRLTPLETDASSTHELASKLMKEVQYLRNEFVGESRTQSFIADKLQKIESELGRSEAPRESLQAIGSSLENIATFLTRHDDVKNISEDEFLRKIDTMLETNLAVKSGLPKNDRLNAVVESLETFKKNEVNKEERVYQAVTFVQSQIQRILRDIDDIRSRDDATLTSTEAIVQKLDSLAVSFEQLSKTNVCETPMSPSTKEFSDFKKELYDSIKSIKACVQVGDNAQAELLQECFENQNKTIQKIVDPERMEKTLEKLGQQQQEAGNDLRILAEQIASLQDAKAISNFEAFASNVNSSLDHISKTIDGLSVQQVQQDSASAYESSVIDEPMSVTSSMFNSPMIRARSASPRKMMRDSLQEERFLELQSTLNVVREKVIVMASTLKSSGNMAEIQKNLITEIQAIGDTCESLKRAQTHMNEVVMGSDQAWRAELRQAIRFDHEKLANVEHSLSTIMDKLDMNQGVNVTHDLLVNKVHEMHVACQEMRLDLEKLMASSKHQHQEGHHKAQSKTGGSVAELDRSVSNESALLSMVEKLSCQCDQLLSSPSNEEQFTQFSNEINDLRDEIRRARALTEPQFSSMVDEIESLQQTVKNELESHFSDIKAILELQNQQALSQRFGEDHTNKEASKEMSQGRHEIIAVLEQLKQAQEELLQVSIELAHSKAILSQTMDAQRVAEEKGNTLELSLRNCEKRKLTTETEIERHEMKIEGLKLDLAELQTQLQMYHGEKESLKTTNKQLQDQREQLVQLVDTLKEELIEAKEELSQHRLLLVQVQNERESVEALLEKETKWLGLLKEAGRDLNGGREASTEPPFETIPLHSEKDNKELEEELRARIDTLLEEVDALERRKKELQSEAEEAEERTPDDIPSRLRRAMSLGFRQFTTRDSRSSSPDHL